MLGKGNKERIVYLNQACQDAIAAYLAVRPKDGVKDRNALFLSNRKTRLKPISVEVMVKKYLEKIGLSGPGYSVHKLRHTAATLMYRYGNVDIRVLQDILGHANLGTTEIYTTPPAPKWKTPSTRTPWPRWRPPARKRKRPRRKTARTMANKATSPRMAFPSRGFLFSAQGESQRPSLLFS